MSAMKETVGKPPGQESPESAAPAMRPGHFALLSTLLEALRSEVGGEVVAKHELYTTRIYVLRGHIVWATASTLARPLGRQLIEDKLISEADLSAVIAECKRTGHNFADTLVSWGLLKMETIREVVLRHLAEGLLQPFSWPSLVTMFVPAHRPYAGHITFELGEALRAAAAFDTAGRTALPWLVSKLAEGNALDTLTALVGAQRAQVAAPAAAPAGAVAPRVAPVPMPVQAPPAHAVLERVAEQLQKLQGLQSCRAAGVVALAGDEHLLPLAGQGAVPEALAQGVRELLASTVEKRLAGGWEPSDVLLETPRGSLLLHPLQLAPLGDLGLFLLVGPETRLGLLRLQLDRLMPDILATRT